MPFSYDPTAWYWTIPGIEGHVFSSALPGMVAVSDAGYVAFLGDGNLPSRLYPGLTTAEAFSELYEVLNAQAPAVAVAMVRAWTTAGYLTIKQAGIGVINLGLALISTETPALNATYSLDPAALSTIQSVYVGIKVGDNFPGGGTTFVYPDITGTAHIFDEKTFVAFALAARDYLFAVQQAVENNTPLPSNTKTIP